MPDELAKAVTKIIFPVLKSQGFHRHGKRAFVRAQCGIAHRVDVQLNGWGGRDFCVNISANVIAGHEWVTLQPGFRLSAENGADLWLPSLSAEQAAESAKTVAHHLATTALPYFEEIKSLPGFSSLLAKEHWASTHHLNFQQGIVFALMQQDREAIDHLEKAIAAYELDGRPWCADYIQRATTLSQALRDGTSGTLLQTWEQVNKKAHGIA
ncbi:DUF4304 domain-containing protein [Novosphingobium terrae]|uniref:DUF4304 domain-containing protein n=1 Tax=Novosphingobium terrae TaxID=2726189 RepID=UPI00197CCA6B|nr:DUF4304 domain-containing protein [Novosphingobium terrae]